MHYTNDCSIKVNLSNLIVMIFISSLVNTHAKQKDLGCKKVRGQSEATLQTGRRDQKV